MKNLVMRMIIFERQLVKKCKYFFIGDITSDISLKKF